MYTTSFVVFPQDCNYMPPMIFGGKMLSEMDIAAAMCVRRLLNKYNSECDSAVTVGVDKVQFYCGAEVGDIITIEATLALDGLGVKRITSSVMAHKEDKHGVKTLMATGLFSFVSRKNEVPSPHLIRI